MSTAGSDTRHHGTQTQAENHPAGNADWLTLPAPVKAIFDRFPLVTYDRNDLPRSRLGERNLHTLFVFTTEANAEAGLPSFNPTCLKWQAYLRFCGVDFVTKPSSNHASPSGALPFLLQTWDDGVTKPPIASRQLRAWAEKAGREKAVSDGELADSRYEAYSSLLDHRLRNAYLHTFYCSTPNFNAITRPLYIESSTSSSNVQAAQAHQLRKTARLELSKQNATIDAEAIYRECDAAFEALSVRLGESKYFFDMPNPDLLDAAVFGYSNLLLDENLQWRNTEMRDCLKKYPNLVRHQREILYEFFPTT